MRPQALSLKLGLLILVSVLSQPALTQCVAPFEQGSWTNIDTATHRGITRIDVSFNCNAQVLCAVDSNGTVTCTNPGPPYRLHLWGKRSPSDCDWGAADGKDRWVGSTKWVFSYYDQGFAKRYVYLKPSTVHPGDLYLWMYTHFTDPSRADSVFSG